MFEHISKFEGLNIVAHFGRCCACRWSSWRVGSAAGVLLAVFISSRPSEDEYSLMGLALGLLPQDLL